MHDDVSNNTHLYVVILTPTLHIHGNNITNSYDMKANIMKQNFWTLIDVFTRMINNYMTETLFCTLSWKSRGVFSQ